MAVIGNLSVSLTAKTAQFQKGLGRATKSISKMARRVGALGTAFGAAALIGIGYYVKQAFGAIDATAKLADTIGLTTEQLVGYQQAVEISGGKIEELSKSFSRMLKNVSDAGLGLSTAQKAFASLGLDADKLKSLETDEIFKKIIDQLGKIPNASDKMRVARDMFGRSFETIIKLSEGGSEGIRKFQAEALKLGTSFSRIDAAKVEAANDAMQRAGAVLKGVVNTLAIKLAPYVEASADKFRSLAMETSSFGTILADTFKTAVEYIKIGSTAITRLQQGFNMLGLILPAIGSVVVTTLDQIGLGLMQIITIEWNLVKAFGQGLKIIPSLWNVAWNGMKTPFVAFIEFAGTQFANFLSHIGAGIANLAPGISKTLLNTSDSILRGVQGITGKATGELGGALDELKESFGQTGDAFTDIFKGIPTKGPLDTIARGLEDRTGALINNIKILEEDNAKFLSGIDSTIADIDSKAAKAATAINKSLGGVEDSENETTAEKRRQSDFKQVSLSRFVLKSQAGSTVKKQKVEAPEFKDMVRLLQQIADGGVGGAVVQ